MAPHHVISTCRHDRSVCSKTCWFILWCSTLASGVFAVDFEVSRISDPKTNSRDPVISETGLAAWTYSSSADLASAYSHIAVYESANKKIDTSTLLHFTGAAKLQFHQNKLAFVANYLDTKQRRLMRPGAPPVTITNAMGEIIQEKRPDIDTSDSVTYALDEIARQSVSQTGDGGRASASRETGQASVSTVWVWQYGTKNIDRMPTTNLGNQGPAIWDNIIVWQSEQEWPFGYEIMYSMGGSEIRQLTTNRYYELVPQVHRDKIVWYGWDGYDYEIFMHDIERDETIQITDNRYDDTMPQIWNDVIVWEGYPGVEGQIYMWKDGQTTRISQNADDDINPRIWENYIVWQGFDGDDFEIYLYDIAKGGEAIKLTSNNFDDTNPRIRDDLLVWMGYHDNWDAEIYYADLRGISSANDVRIERLTDNDVEDRDVSTAGRRIIWVTEESGTPQIMLAEPR
jgi:beta propeller repeat protein